jgi:hypothetical protein
LRIITQLDEHHRRRVQLQRPGGRGLQVRLVHARTRAAQKACQGIIPGPGSGGSGNQGPSKQTFLAFARCLRNHGVSGFPDPNAQGQLTLQMINDARVDLKAPSFFTAAKVCVGVTHGAITLPDVARAVDGPH